MPTFVVGGFLVSAAVVAYNVATVSFRQRLCPPELLGRMNASARFLVWGTIPVGAFLGGALAGAIGTTATLWVAAAFGLLAFVPVCTPKLWRLRQLSEPEQFTPDASTTSAPGPAAPASSAPIGTTGGNDAPAPTAGTTAPGPMLTTEPATARVTGTGSSATADGTGEQPPGR
ncbi:hypothetical protein GIS00_21630 [Nakamurella sp. YIM 132087]|uniref:MFS transporter n=1 Tax=Nakamurella alba TaxID=2665158 RepID=A0A7K1FQW4_9ACTN|nr:hypothetical protein [Nakamurella alba]MTD16542.1 hypothetical protein [Nakamurella alba]